MNDLVAELETINLGDQRLDERARRVLADLGAQPGASIPGACGGWPETKAAYRLFDHDRVGPQEVLEAPAIQSVTACWGARQLVVKRWAQLGCTRCRRREP